MGPRMIGGYEVTDLHIHRPLTRQPTTPESKASKTVTTEKSDTSTPGGNATAAADPGGD